MYIALIVLLSVLIFILLSKKKAATPEEKGAIKAQQKQEAPILTERDELPIAGAYQKRWLFSYHEKDAFYKLFELCQKYGLYLTAKARLLDLVEPVKNNPKYKSYFWKVQAKHVDFVICDKKLVARCVIELDDNSHDTPGRKERDEFVDEVLKSAGYTVIHLREIDTTDIEKQVQTIFSRFIEK